MGRFWLFRSMNFSAFFKLATNLIITKILLCIPIYSYQKNHKNSLQHQNQFSKFQLQHSTDTFHSRFSFILQLIRVHMYFQFHASRKHSKAPEHNLIINENQIYSYNKKRHRFAKIYRGGSKSHIVENKNVRKTRIILIFSQFD